MIRGSKQSGQNRILCVGSVAYAWHYSKPGSSDGGALILS